MFLMINVLSVIHFQWNIVLATVNSSHSLCTQRCQLQMAKGVAAGEHHRIEHAEAHGNRSNPDEMHSGTC